MDDKTRNAAEARFDRSRKADQAAKASLSAQETEARAVTARTAKLKAERLAREAADPAAAAKKPRAAKKATARKGVGSY